MKPHHEVEKTKREYHQFPNKKTVHRSSLLVPNIDGSDPYICFLNHFLIKRGYPNVACKITAIGPDGNRLESLTTEITEPRVYTFNLNQVFSEVPERPSQYLVEFFSERNLYIPFPAVMVNHVGTDFCNVLHSYNRVLNDVFEDGEINRVEVAEASIDFVSTGQFETFFQFATGPQQFTGPLKVSYADRENTFDFEMPVSVARLSNQSIVVSDHFPRLKGKNGGVLKIHQPKQSMFYGRLLAGVLNTKTKSFSANHSYYDSSQADEYFDNDESYRTYPFFEEFSNQIVMYPIMSPGEIGVKVRIVGTNGTFVSDEMTLVSPSDRPVLVDINDLVAEKGIEGARAFTVIAKAHRNRIPTRVNHQLIYGEKSKKSALRGSINVSLINKQVFVPQNKKGYTWGQTVVGKDYVSRLGVQFDSEAGSASDIHVEFYNSEGLFHSEDRKCSPGSSLIFDMDEIQRLIPSPHQSLDFIWFLAKSDRADLQSYAFHVNKISGNGSGEHGF